MMRMRVWRWTINFLCGGSLLVFTLSAALWGRSLFVADQLYRSSQGAWGGVDYELLSSRGTVQFWREADVGISQPTQSGWAYLRSNNPKPFTIAPATRFDRVNFHFAGLLVVYTFWTTATPAAPGWVSQATLILPLWLSLPFAIPPILWWRRRRRANGRGFEIDTASDSASKADVEPAVA